MTETTPLHFVLRYSHILMAATALVAGAAAMSFAKGSALHRKWGNVFFVSMMIMSGAGAYIATFIVPVGANVMGGMMAFYLTLTAWLTAWRKPGATGRLEIGAALLGLGVVIAGTTWGLAATRSPNGLYDQFPAMGYFIFAGVALFGTTLDFRVIARGGLTGAPRLTRHLWRMSFALFMATGSFFFGQAKLFPAPVRESGLLAIPALLPLALMLYWLVRVRVWPRIRNSRIQRPKGLGAIAAAE